MGSARYPARFDLQERLISFAARIIRLTEALPATKTGNHIRGQLLRCGTSPAPNYAEAQSAESRSDFIHKIQVVLKELRETRVWLVLTERVSLIKNTEIAGKLISECDELIAIFVRSVNTAKSRKNIETRRQCDVAGASPSDF